MVKLRVCILCNEDIEDHQSRVVSLIGGQAPTVHRSCRDARPELTKHIKWHANNRGKS